MSDAFSGLKILDFTTTIAGPHCTRLFADLGAEIIKIEAPEGDMMRTRAPLRSGVSSVFGQLNAGKKSVMLDLKQPAAIEAVRRIAATCDVIVENFRPGVMARFKLDYETLAQANPKLVYCAISGYGQTGPAADRPAYAPVVHATSGFDLAHMAHQPGRTRPDNCGVYVADILAGAYAFGAIGAALNQRHQTGRGQLVDLSMLEAMLSVTIMEVQGAQFPMPPPPSRPVFGPVSSSDGYVNIAIASERSFRNLAAAAGRPDWIGDPRFRKYLDRRANWGALMEEFEAWSTTLTSAELLVALDRSNVPAAAYRTVPEAMQDPQILHRHAFSEVADAGGTFRALNPPFRLSTSRTAAGPEVANLGQQTSEVLAEYGYSPSEIAELDQP
jgi:CoA:oxalate CoA-transferase